MTKPAKKSSPSYLLKLGNETGTNMAFVLVTSNQDRIARGERLTASQFNELTDTVVANLKTFGKLPSDLSGERLKAFTDPFQEKIIKSGLY